MTVFARNTGRSMSSAALLVETPPGVGPGRYEASAVERSKPGESRIGGSAFVGSERACCKTATGARAPGPGAHRPEDYTALGRRAPAAPPRTATLSALRRPFVASREEVRQRGTPASIPSHTRQEFAYEETAQGTLRPIPAVLAPPPGPEQRVGPGSYNPTDIRMRRAGPRIDFSRGSGRALPASWGGKPPQLASGAPVWHDGASANPLPAQPMPSSSFAEPKVGPDGGSSAAAKPGHLQRPASAGLTASGSEASLGGISVDGSLLSGAAGLDQTVPAWHVCRHSRGRTNVRARLVSSTGVPEGGGGLLGRQLAIKNAHKGDPGPGQHALPPGVGSTKPIPRGGLPRPKPFRSAHLRALGTVMAQEGAASAPPAPTAMITGYDLAG